MARFEVLHGEDASGAAYANGPLVVGGADTLREALVLAGEAGCVRAQCGCCYYPREGLWLNKAGREVEHTEHKEN